jgi:hypothetical protein
MYKVSQAFRKAMKQNVQSYRMKGTIGSTVFDDSNILQGTFSITNQCSDTTAVQIGQVYIGELKVTLTNLDAQRYSLKNKELTPFFGMRLEDGSYEDIPLGIFTVSEANWGISGVEITAYDHMAKLEEEFNASKLEGTPFEISTLACKACGVELGTSGVEFSTFVNGTVRLEIEAENDVSTWRELLSWVAETCGCNVMADRYGKIVFRAYGDSTVDEIDASHRFAGCTFGDYTTRYTGLSVVDNKEQQTKYYHQEVDDGLTYNLGANPFLQINSKSDIEAIRKNILAALSSIKYVPFKTTLIGSPAYDLMDVFCFSGGSADGTKISCMTKYVFNYNRSYEMEGVGQNPALFTRNSKSDKDLSGLVSEVDSITSSINNLLFDYNTGRIVFGQRERIAGMITYYISKTADVEGHFLMNYTASESTHVIVRFYDVNVEELFSPLEYDLPAGDGTLGIPHSYLSRAEGVHSAYVTVQCTLGTIVSETRDIFFTINAGNYAEAVDEIGMDIRDITMRQLLESNGPDQIWCIGIENKKALLSRREYSDSHKSRQKWEGIYTPGEAIDAAVEFDGDWVLRTGADKFTIETEAEPWLFWITEDHSLYAQHGLDEETRFLMDSGIASVHACKGYNSQMYKSQDQGLVVVYVSDDGSACYRQYTLNTETGEKIWSNAIKLREDEFWKEANVHRLNDYRLGFELTNDRHNLWMLTERTYVGQSVYPENAGFRDSNLTGFSFFGKNDEIDFAGKAVLFDDPTKPETVFKIRYEYPVLARSKSFSGPIEVYVNGTKLGSGDYAVELQENFIVITMANEVAATRADEASVKVDVSAKDAEFYLSNGDHVNRIILDDASFSWTIERKIITVNIHCEENVVLQVLLDGSYTTTKVKNQINTNDDHGAIHVSSKGAYITTRINHVDSEQKDEASMSIAAALTIMTYMTDDAPI